MTLVPFDPKAAWERASPELRELGKTAAVNAASVAMNYFTHGPRVLLPAEPTAAEVLAAADALDGRLGEKAARREELEHLVEGALRAAVKIAVAAALAT